MDCATYICEEILIEILRRLPVKSLIRFMAVCRLWKTIITSPQFRSDSKRASKLLVHTAEGLFTLVEDGEEEKRLVMFETDFPFKKHCSDDGYAILGSDNGLVCIKIFTKKPDASVIIWNPFIRKHVAIPDVGDGIIRMKGYASGFGGTTSGDYKYVRIVGCLFLYAGIGERSKKTAVYIYSLKAGTWRRKYLDDDSVITEGMEGFYGTCALLRGRLHWIDGVGLGKEINSFELEDEVFGNKIIMPPESIQSAIEGIYVSASVIRESLAVIASGKEIGGLPRHSSTVCVWVMEEYGDVDSWNKLFNIVVEGLCHVGMAHLMKDGELLLVLRESNYEYPYDQKLVTCNPKTMETCDFGPSFFPEVRGFTYNESLVLLGDDYHAAAAADPFFQEECPVSVSSSFSGIFVLVLAEL